MQSSDQPLESGPGQVICPSEIESVEQALTRLVRLAETRRTANASAGPQNRLDRAAYTLLTRLDECPTARLTELAARMEIDLSTASRQVRGLEDKGFVARVDDPSDQRAAHLELTEAGREVLCSARALRVERIASRLAHWDRGDLEELDRLLSKLVESFTDQPSNPPAASPSSFSATSGARR